MLEKPISFQLFLTRIVREINFRAIGFRNQAFWKEKKIRQVFNEKRTDAADGV